MVVVVLMRVFAPPFTEYFMPVEKFPLIFTSMLPAVRASMVRGTVIGSTYLTALTLLTLRVPL